MMSCYGLLFGNYFKKRAWKEGLILLLFRSFFSLFRLCKIRETFSSALAFQFAKHKLLEIFNSFAISRWVFFIPQIQTEAANNYFLFSIIENIDVFFYFF